jgi:RNA polymerase sigma factor (sigma-70 family)
MTRHPSESSEEREPNQPDWSIISDETRQAFYERFLSITDPSSYCGRISGGITYAFIRRTLRQYNLETVHTENDILNETFLRALEKLDRQETIANLQAWIRSTSLNVIREWSRARQKTISIGDRDIADTTQIESPLDLLESDQNFNREVAALHSAFRKLQHLDQVILELKVIKGYSWETVNQILQAKGFGCFTITALRKRKQRSLTQLKIALK